MLENKGPEVGEITHRFEVTYDGVYNSKTYGFRFLGDRYLISGPVVPNCDGAKIQPVELQKRRPKRHRFTPVKLDSALYHQVMAALKADGKLI